MVGAAIHWRPAAACCAILALGLLAPGPSARAANIDPGTGIRIDIPLKSMKDLRDQRLVKQRFDYSCGAAALDLRMSPLLGTDGPGDNPAPRAGCLRRDCHPKQPHG